ncbi:MAG TPA: DUF2269 family protein [Candidatus Limnocylindria bacterium]|nr:DUF2269 family protein [Candidatus Limnocylindria bacterium]
MPDLHGWIVFVHVAGVLIAFLAHGVSAGMAFKLTTTREPAAVRALIDMSRTALFVFAGALLVVVASGIAAGFTGGHWGRLWIWTSIALFVAVFVAMTPMAAQRIRAVREILLQEEGAQTADAIATLLDAWRPMPTAVLGVSALLVITWLMMFRPF